MFVFLDRLFGVDTDALIEMGKVCGAAAVEHGRFLVCKFDTAEKLHQACFVVVTSSHNVLGNNSSYVRNNCNAVARNMGVKNALETCVISHR